MTQADRQAVLVVNTKSRRGQDSYQRARQLLTEQGVTLTGACAVHEPSRIAASVERAIDAGCPLVVVGGGDGTLGSVAAHFVGTGSVLGVLPLGTGNEFARDLHIPNDLARACEIIARGSVSEIDLGCVNDRYFVNVATIGLSTRIAQALTPEAKHRWGKFVYVVAVARALARLRPFNVVLQTEHGTRQMRSVQVVIGNGRFHAGPFPLSPTAAITDGKLTVYAIESASRWHLLRYALSLPGGNHVRLPDVTTVETAGGELHTHHRKHVTVDGEVALHTPLRFKVVPRALRVMTPEPMLPTS